MSPQRSRLAASQLSGEPGSGWASSNEMAKSVDCKVQAGDQAVLRISRQISPVYGRKEVFRKVGEWCWEWVDGVRMWIKS